MSADDEGEQWGLRMVDLRRRSLPEQCAWWAEQLAGVAERIGAGSRDRAVVASCGLFLVELARQVQEALRADE